MDKATTDRPVKSRQWVRKGERLRITLDVEVLHVEHGKANLKVIGEPTAECIGEPTADAETPKKT